MLIDVLLTIFLFTSFALVFFLLIGDGRDGGGTFHVTGPGEVYCPTCDGTCREIEQEQAALSEFK